MWCWDPVAVDVEGRPEVVAAYEVEYALVAGAGVGPVVVGAAVVQAPTVCAPDGPDPAVGEALMVVVEAVDVAGNVSGVVTGGGAP